VLVFRKITRDADMLQPEYRNQAGQAVERTVMTQPPPLPERAPHYPVAVIGLALTCTLLWFGFWIWLTARALRTMAS
jgi:hypothetical protein